MARCRVIGRKKHKPFHLFPYFLVFYNLRNGQVSRECKCKFREEEKLALQKLNLRHQELVEVRDKKIKELQRKLEGLTSFKEEFVKEERRKVVEEIEHLREEIADLKRARSQSFLLQFFFLRSEELISEATQKAEMEEQRRRLRETEEMLARREEEVRRKHCQRHNGPEG